METESYRPRLIDDTLRLYLEAFPAVCIEGPKWCGKTWTGVQFSKSIFDVANPNRNFANRELARMDVMKALDGATPHLIDEWQSVPSIWDAVRFAADQKNETGRFILTGSATPTTKGIEHSGTGRIACLPMHTMSLYESGDSDGMISLADVCNGNDIGTIRVTSHSLDDLISYVVRGGWPGSIGKSQRVTSLLPKQYIESVIRSDINKMDDVEYDYIKVLKCLRSLARNESTTASNATIRKDIEENDVSSLGINTVGAYISAFKRMFLTNDIEPFSTFLRSPIRIKQSVKRHFCDPSIPVALMRATGNMLMRNIRTFGFLFESLALRDLQIYAEAMNGRLYHYQDYAGNEIDAVIQFDDDSWSAFEVKLNPNVADEAAENLKKVNRLFKHNPAKSLAVVVGCAINAYRRPDGVYVLPLTSLRP